MRLNVWQPGGGGFEGMDKAEFLTLVDSDLQPPNGLSPCLHALLLGCRGVWDDSHDMVNDIDTPLGSWIHAWLHRVEGDLSNARYWYRLAGREEATAALDVEWEALVEAALAADPSA